MGFNTGYLIQHGMEATVFYIESPILIKNLPEGNYAVLREGKRIIENTCPRMIPVCLLSYPEKGSEYFSRVAESITNLNLTIMPLR